MSTLFNDLMQGLKEVEAYMAGAREGYRVHVPADVDVKEIRGRLGMTQAKFSEAFGFSLDAVKHWEGGRRTPEASARAFLTVISKNPMAVLGALDSKAKAAKVTARVGKGQAARPARAVRRAA